MAHVVSKKNGPAIWLPLLACFFWLVFTLALYRQAARVDEAHRLELEHTRLSTVARQLMDARNWNAAHGGVYVLKSAYGQPNPWLPEAERTVDTADGRTLVLMNPAYMSRQLAERNSEPGIGISIISNVPLRPENKADAWESEALVQCTEGAREIFSAPETDGEGKLRLLSVLVAQESCLRCHQGRMVGEVLGGISVSQNAEAYMHNAGLQQRNMRLLYSLLGLTGVLAIGGLTLNLTRRRWLAEETSRMKSAFMARLSHDMRTPLTAILGMSELLQQKSVPEKERRNALRYLTQAGSALLEMVRDVTDHASLEQGALQLRAEPFSLRAALEGCTALFRPMAEAKGLDIDLDVDPQLPDAVVGDSFRLRQALGNLVSNAVKFTELGRVRVCVGPAERKSGGAPFGSADALCLRILVQDTGPGLPLEDAERIFESFQRGSDASSAPGTGLGLYIARTIARRMGGDVTVTSAPGRGACFALEVCLQLPGCAEGKKSGNRHDSQPAAAPPHGACAAPETGPGTVSGAAGAAMPPCGSAVPESSVGSESPSASALSTEPASLAAAASCSGSVAFSASLPTSSPVWPCAAESALADAATDVDGGADSDSEKGCFTGRRILVAEDNEANRYIMEYMLRAEGARVRMARDGKAALAALARGPWDLVILDARMPDMSGLDVLQAVRLGHADVPARQKTVIYTAALDAQDRRRCKELGADLVLLKPLTFAVLRKELASLLAAGDTARAPAGAVPASSEPVSGDLAAGEASSGHASAPAPEGSPTVPAPRCEPEFPAYPEDSARAASRGLEAGAGCAPDTRREEALALWNRQAAMDALDDDPQLLTQLAGVLRGDLRIRDAELEKALAAGDDACLRRLGHAVKNSAGTMRFDVLRARACHVEQAQKPDLGLAVTRMRAALRETLDMLDKELGKDPDKEPGGVDAMPGKTLLPEPVAGFAAGTAQAGCKGGC